MKRRLLPMLLCLSLCAVSLTGCGGTSAYAQLSKPTHNPQEASTPPAPTAEPTPEATSEKSTVFTDVPADHWACDSIESAFAKGIINGIGDQKFGTGQTLTRAQTAQIMFNAYGGSGLTDETVKIEDAPDGAWYTEAVTWLLQYDLAELREGKFYPDEPAPRWFIADVLYKLAAALDVEMPKENEAVAFPDMIGDYAPYSEAVTALQQAGIISG
ncbi:MAG: S-layer homology domain-containing protein, partial [Clostridiales bacterium]|nr:S-layer homology domain-containing protein [Clostridiales bacterium]